MNQPGSLLQPAFGDCLSVRRRDLNVRASTSRLPEEPPMKLGVYLNAQQPAGR